MKYNQSIIYILLFCFGINLLKAQDRNELEERKAKINKEIEMLNANIRKMSSDKTVTLRQLQALNAELRLREQKIKMINSEIDLLDKKISEKEAVVSNLQTQLEQLRKEYARTIRLAYRNKSAYTRMMYIFSANDFNKAYRRMQYLKQFGEYRQVQFRKIQSTQKVLNINILELDKIKHEKSHVLASQVEEKKTIGKEKKVQETVVFQIAKQEKELKGELKRKEAEAKKLNKMIQAAIRKEIEEANAKANATAKTNAKANNKSSAKSNVNILNATPETAQLSSDFLENKGNLPWPVANGVITQGMGTTKVEKNVTVQIDGVLIQTNPGAAVRSVFAGEVVRVLDLGANVAVLIRHGEYFTVYANMRTASVSKGQKVGIKQSIGTIATDSSDNIPELKFGLWKGSSPQNPENWLAK